jgi:hypothetical protein
VCGVGVFGSHLITQILTSSHFHPDRKKVGKLRTIAMGKGRDGEWGVFGKDVGS